MRVFESLNFCGGGENPEPPDNAHSLALFCHFETPPTIFLCHVPSKNKFEINVIQKLGNYYPSLLSNPIPFSRPLTIFVQNDDCRHGACDVDPWVVRDNLV